MTSIKKDLKDNKVIVTVIPNNVYKDVIIKMIKDISNMSKITYVSCNKTIKFLKELLEKNKIKHDNFFFIDSISKTMGEPKKEKCSAFICSPNAIDELAAVINKQMKKSDLIFFDSLSTLLVYHNDTLVTRFTYSIINRTRENNKSVILTILEKDKNTNLYKNIAMSVDKIITMK